MRVYRCRFCINPSRIQESSVAGGSGSAYPHGQSVQNRVDLLADKLLGRHVARGRTRARFQPCGDVLQPEQPPWCRAVAELLDVQVTEGRASRWARLATPLPPCSSITNRSQWQSWRDFCEQADGQDEKQQHVTSRSGTMSRTQSRTRGPRPTRRCMTHRSVGHRKGAV